MEEPVGGEEEHDARVYGGRQKEGLGRAEALREAAPDERARALAQPAVHAVEEAQLWLRSSRCGVGWIGQPGQKAEADDVRTHGRACGWAD